MKKPRPPLRPQPKPLGPTVLPVPADIDRARVARRGEALARGRRQAVGRSTFFEPRTDSERRAEAEKRAMFTLSRCRTDGCALRGHPISGFCQTHARTRRASMLAVDPPMDGRCNALFTTRSRKTSGWQSGWTRCKAKPQYGQDRCPHHRGMPDHVVEPPPGDA